LNYDFSGISMASRLCLLPINRLLSLKKNEEKLEPNVFSSF
jgi:hypothetical protein